MGVQYTTPSMVASGNLLTMIDDPPFKVDAALYFLCEAGHYLLRIYDNGQTTSKFVTANDVQAAFTQKEEDSGWLPPGVVRTGYNAAGRWYVYSAPAQKVDIQIEGEGKINVPIPRTVMLGIGQKYYIWAMVGKHFDSIDLAFHAPFPNVYSEGLICWGDTTPPEADPCKARKPWELFFGTIFNEHQAGSRSRKYKDDVRKMLLEAAGKRSYPVDDLIGIGRIGDIIGRLIR